MVTELSAGDGLGQGRRQERRAEPNAHGGILARRSAGFTPCAALCFAAALLAGVANAAAGAPGLSDWAASGHSRARLLALGPPAGGGSKRQAAVEIALDPGFLTYWRQPGEAGLPPTLDTSASDNIAAVAMEFPAPGLFQEGGVPLYGYRTAVTLPLAIELADPARPATLAVALDYAVCSTICLPGKAALRLPLPTTTDPIVQARIDAARDAVPRRQTLGGGGPRGIERVERDFAAPGRALAVTAHGAAPANLFVEAPEGWFLTAHAPTTGEGGTLRFPVTVDEAPHGEAGRGTVELRLTLVDAQGAVEVPVRVDVGAATP